MKTENIWGGGGSGLLIKNPDLRHREDMFNTGIVHSDTVTLHCHISMVPGSSVVKKPSKALQHVSISQAPTILGKEKQLIVSRRVKKVAASYQ